MGFLKRFTNFILPSLSTTYLLLILLLFLNPSAQFQGRDLLNLFIILLPFYTFSSFFLIFLITDILSFFLEKKFVDSFFNTKLISSLFSFISISIGILFLLNSRFFSIYIIPEVKKKIEIWSFILILIGFVTFFLVLKLKIPAIIYPIFYFLIFALLFFSSRERHWKEATTVSTVFEWVKGQRIVVLQMDGLTLDFIAPLTSEKKIPNFSYIMENGSWLMIKNFRPHDKETLFTTFNTGKYPYKHKGFGKCYKFKNVSPCLYLLPRFIFLYKLEIFGIFETQPLPSTSEGILSTLKYFKIPSYVIESSESKISSETILKFKNIIGEFPKNNLTDFLLNSFAQDEEVFQEALSTKQKSSPIYLHALFSGLDTVERRFWKYSRPEQPLMEEPSPLYSMVIDRYYDYYDSIIGSFLSTLKEDEVLIIYSPYGMSPIPLWKRILNFIYGTEEISAYHDNAPDGIAIFIGSSIEKGGFQGEAEIVDMAPTLLYLMGFPVARDMDGSVIKKLIDPKILKRNPIFFIRSYESEISIRMMK